MSTLNIAGAAPLIDVVAVVTAAVRAPSAADRDPNGDYVLTFTPDLTAAETTAVNGAVSDLVGANRTRDLSLSLAEFRAIKPQLAEIRAFRTRTLAQWNALTAAQRESDEISYLNDLTDVLRALLRQ